MIHPLHAQPEHLAAYISALKSHDWSFEWSDDHRVWRAGKDSLEALRSAQKFIDPDGMVWNQFAPVEWQIRLPQGATA